ncbi:MAG: flagellar hook-basal body complex protein FliE [Clostridia bacterium]|nr:flagellar hook-basal body complex protein FliE [Clostridia bacterium]
MIDKIGSIANISNISNITSIKNMGNNKISTVQQKSEFDNLLGNAVKDIVESEKTNAENLSKLASGNLDNINETLIGIVESDLTIQYTMQIRNKIVEAYKEIMGMQI